MISIIIVNWNTGDLLKQCLLSLDALPDHALIDRVIVVDNNSGDQSIETAQKASYTHLKPEFMLLPMNVGFTRANNIAIEKLPLYAGHHILLLNPDTQMTASALTTFSIAGLQGIAENNPRIGVIGPKLLNPDQSLQPSVRRLPTLAVFIFLMLKLHRFFPKAAVWQQYMATDFDYDKEQAAEQVMGAAFFIRDELWQGKVGLFDKHFWIWFEEVDYCKRVRDAGYLVWYAPQVSIIHHGGVSFNQLVGLKRAMPFINSMLTYTKKNLGIIPFLVLLTLTPFGIVLGFLTGFVHAVRK